MASRSRECNTDGARSRDGKAAGGSPSLLIVDDEEGIRHGLSSFFRRKNFTVHTSEDFDSALAAAREKPLDVALIDLRLKGKKGGMDILAELRKLEPDLVAIVITGYGSIDTAVASMKEGASDYIVKPIDNQKLLDSVNKNLELRRLKNENLYLRSELLNRYYTGAFVTRNREMVGLVRRADRIKNSPVTVLITGESGTGKEVLARYIHFTSNRKEREFVTINCAALSESLLLSELFGHERGAYTGAVERQIGKFEIADRGTIFLDEIGDMSREIQAKLLRVIEESSFERVGGSKRITVDARIIVATNRDLKKLIDEGRFREDLYYRVNVVSFSLAPLRERREDIPPLVDHFLRKYGERYNKKAERFEESALRELVAYGWPGNIRELENVVNQAVLLSDGPVLEARSLKRSLFHGRGEGSPLVDLSEVRSLKGAVADIVAHYEREIIGRFLDKNGNNRSKTARELAVTRKTLAEKIARYGLASRGRITS